MMNTRSRFFRGFGVVAAVTLLGSGMAGCSANGEAATTEETFDSATANREYVTCMQDASIPVTLENNQVLYSTESDEELEAYRDADAACQKLLEEAGIAPAHVEPDEDELRGIYDALTEGYKCIESLGYYQDPWPSYEVWKVENKDGKYGGIPVVLDMPNDYVGPSVAELEECEKGAFAQ